MKTQILHHSKIFLSIAAMTTAMTSASIVSAQDSDVNAIDLEEVVVVGTRRTIQTSIDAKRTAVAIVDGLSADEIGDIPALSIGEALETVTGASSHRENGGATEVSIRGLGPFLTNTVINGREATNGAGNRAVNFSIFPSELFNKIGIYKTQSASFIEGAVGGQIRLDTKKPIEHGKQSITLNLKGAYNENEQDIRGGQDLGYRGTISFIDQFETENLGTFGVSLGLQARSESNPEQEFTRSNTPRVCDLDNDTGLPTGTTCSDDQNFLRGLTPDAETGVFATDEDRESFAFLSSSAQFRQNVTDDERNSFFGGFQWQPNERLDLNLDIQLSERIQEERRSDLVFAEINRNIDEETTVIENGVLQSFANISDLNGSGQENNGQEIQLIGQDFIRDEEYEGFGFDLEYLVNDKLTVSFDVAYSNTFRLETEESLRLADEVERVVSADFTGANRVGVFNVQNTSTNFDSSSVGAFDATDLGEFLRGATPTGVGSTAADFIAAFDEDSDFDDRLRARTQNDIRENTITSLRGDFEFQTENLGFVSSVDGGVRYSELEYERRGNINNDTNLNTFGGGSDDQAALLANIANNCIDAPFETSFEEVSSSQNVLFLNSPSINAGCSLDAVRAAIVASDRDIDIDPSTAFNSNSIDVEESTFAAYLQANYETSLFGLPARGNFGVRLVSTDVDSRTFRSPFELDDNGDSFELDNPSASEIESALSSAEGANFNTEINASSSYTELLPSATLVLDLTDDVILRTGIFRGISRSDPAILGTRQQVGTVEQDDLDENITTEDIASFLSDQTTTGGSADLDPFTSWNVDLALEWYPNKDTILAAGAYYKQFRGGYQNTVVNDQFLITNNGGTVATQFGDNGVITTAVNSLQTTNESNNLYGIEVTASHSFNYLPGFWSGFGGKLSYNYASSDFDFEDDFAGAGFGVSTTGETVELTGLIPSADIFGLSRNVASAQLYWSGGAFDLQLIGKHRSSYFQQFTDTPGRIRFVDDNTVVEFRASYQLNDAVKLSFEALNLTDEPRTDFRGIDGNVAQVLSFGPRYFFGIKASL